LDRLRIPCMSRKQRTPSFRWRARGTRVIYRLDRLVRQRLLRVFRQGAAANTSKRRQEGDAVTFSNILFPVDFSERSNAMAPHVRAACERFNASLTLLHLIEVPLFAYSTTEAPFAFDLALDELTAEAEQHLAEYASATFPGTPVKTVVQTGDAAACIAELAQTWGIDLIMMPTKGRGRFRAALLGSVTAKTLHDAHCAVWTSAHCNDMEQHTEWRRIVCAIDTDDEGVRLIRFAAELAAASNARVSLAHAVPEQVTGSEPVFGSDFTVFLKDQARTAIAKMQTETETRFPVCIEAGTIARVLRHAAESHCADLVVIGRGLLPRFAGGLRSHTYAIVREMPCPVLSI
jgi:nucleotide-binding universal stress UspA family protein